jgi:RHS repeat-associated protein
MKFSGIKTYDFEYDGLNRLAIAQYADGDKYSTTYEYDKNGNIDHLERWMEIEGAKQQIDDLVYHYHSDGNQLKVVNDNPTLTHHEYGFADNGSFQNTEYNYDENGNMIEDLNKGIDLITYNHLNLPTHIYFANNGTAGRRIGYVYTADGIKLRKYTHLNTNAEGPVTDYVGAFVYENNELQFIQTSEGRLVPDGNGRYDYEYALKDLPIAIGTGNTRVMFDQTGEVLQDQSYYPFGLSMGEALTFHMPSTLPDNKYLYNGKELQDDFDLGWYDYGARFYDPALGIWHNPDALSEWYYDFTPYAYVGSNPISFLDPDGNFRTKFGAWWYKLWNGGDGIAQDKGGEYFVYTDEVTTDDEGVNVTSRRVFDKNGRNKGKDLEYEAAKERWVAQYKFHQSMEKMGVEVYYTDNRTEAISGMLQIPSMVVMPNILKGTTGVVNTAKQGSRIKASSIKELKRLIKQLSKPGSELTKKELRQLTKLVEKYGGKIRKDLNPIKGRIKKPHVQVTGLGKSIEHRHIWLKSGVN